MNRRDFLAGCGVCAAFAALDNAWRGAAKADAARQNLTTDLSPGYRPSGKSSEAGLWLQMKQLEEQIGASHLIIPDHDLKLYLSDLACRLGHGYCTDLRAYPMRVPHFNASMAPNGMMQVWSGLLLRVSNEAQLAAVIGHELGHYLRRHSLKHWETARDTTNLLSFLTLGVAAAGLGADNQNLLRLAGFGLIFSHGRKNEREADAFGTQLMTEAGYNPWAAPAMWRRVVAEAEVGRVKRAQNPFFATHPAPEERVQNLTAQAQSLGRAESDTSAESGNFLAIVGKHRAMLIEDQLKLRQFNQTALILSWLLEDGYRLGETKYYLGELYRLEGDLGAAKTAYEAALTGDGVPPEVHRALGLLHLKEQKRPAANDAFARYLTLKPTATDRAMIVSYMESS